MLSSSENKAISDEEPKKYLPEFITKLDQQTIAVFNSNLLPLPDEFNYVESEFSDFIEKRSELIIKYISELCTGNVP